MKHVILAAGLGTRLRDHSTLHKAFIKLNNKPIIDHLLEKAKGEVILIVGHQKEILYEYLKDRPITWVVVDQLIGPGYSLKQAEHLLQEPFYLQMVDSLIEEIPEDNVDWIAIAPGDSFKYYTVETKGESVIRQKDKGKGYSDAFTGLAFIKDYQTFWRGISYTEITDAFKLMNLKAKRVKWLDTGNLKELEKVLELDPRMPRRIDRETYIQDKVITVSQSYPYVTYKEFAGENLYGLDQLELYLGAIPPFRPISAPLHEVCRKVYYHNTLDAVKNKPDLRINGKFCRLENLLGYIRWDWLFGGFPALINGVGFDRIFWNGQYTYEREYFGGQFYGDYYWDLAQIYVSAKINLKKIRHKTYKLIEGDYISIYGTTTGPLYQFLDVYEDYLSPHIDYQRVRTIAALIMLQKSKEFYGPASQVFYCMGLEELYDLSNMHH